MIATNNNDAKNVNNRNNSTNTNNNDNDDDDDDDDDDENKAVARKLGAGPPCARDHVEHSGGLGQQRVRRGCTTTDMSELPSGPQ